MAPWRDVPPGFKIAWPLGAIAPARHRPQRLPLDIARIMGAMFYWQVRDFLLLPRRRREIVYRLPQAKRGFGI